MATPETPRQKLIDQIRTALGGSMMDLDLEEKDFDYCIDVTLDRYRQRSGNSIEESFVFLDVQPDVQIYTLPQSVQEVVSVYRNTIGNAGGSSFDPFSAGYINSIYMLQNPSGLGGGGSGQLMLFDAASQFQSLAARLFGRDITYTWDAYTKRITFHRRFRAVEHVGLHVYNEKPEENLIQDVYAKSWIRSMAVAQAKMLLGQARSTFGSIAGPSGGVTLNGAELKSEALAEMVVLDEELIKLYESGSGYGFVIG